MILKNCGHIYRFPLDFDLGFAYAESLDYRDVRSFDGLLLSVFNLVEKSKKPTTTIKELVNSGLMFGPLPIYKAPNVRGKRAWKYIGKHESYSKTPPQFKYLLMGKHFKDWSTIQPWRIVSYDSKELKEVNSYEDVRHLETTILSSTLGFTIRTTMQYLVAKGEDVSKYYDLKETIYWNLYVYMANTSYSKEFAKELLEKVDDKPSK